MGKQDLGREKVLGLLPQGPEWARLRRAGHGVRCLVFKPSAGSRFEIHGKGELRGLTANPLLGLVVRLLEPRAGRRC